MIMNYFALFLDGGNYIEKCLILIKYISRPKSKSLPHITLRFFEENDPKTDYINYLTQKKIFYLDIIEPGTFNLKEQNGSYVVFLRCESEELEEIDYRPDFPYSRLHITLYEGSDLEYAKNLYDELAKQRWLIRMVFDMPKQLSKQTLGRKVPSSFDFDRAYEDVLGDSSILSDVSNLSNAQKLEQIRAILEKLSQHLKHSQFIAPTYVNSTSFGKADYFDNSVIKRVSEDQEDQYFTPEFPEGIARLSIKDKMVTSPEYARDMAACALELFGDDIKYIHFGDSAIGTGALFIAVKRLLDTVNSEQNKQYTVGSAIGVDIDRDRAREAYLRCSSRNLRIILDDALSPETDLGPKRNMMLVNPPYTRSSRIPRKYRSHLQQLAKDITGIDISGKSSLYVYHLLIMHKWLEEDGVAVWLIPTAFLHAEYAKAVREYLTEKVQLLHLHVYNEEAVQFEKANIATTVVAFRNHVPNAQTAVKVTSGNSMKQPSLTAELMLEDFHESIRNWRGLIFETPEKKDIKGISNIKLSDLFDVKRGLATGANSFFVINREKAEEYGIPSVALKPILPKARYLRSLIIHDQGDGYPDVEPQLVLIDCSLDETTIKDNYPAFYEYLQQAKEKDDRGKAIVDRTLVKSRSPWYKQELRDPPRFLLTYMGRDKEELPPLYFVLNQSKAVALNTYILLYPKAWLTALLEADQTLCEKLLESLNHVAENIIAHRARGYSGGLKKIEPNELKDVFLMDLPQKVSEVYYKKNAKQL